MSREYWKDIPGFPGYQASIDGEIRSFRKYGEGKILKGCLYYCGGTQKRKSYVLQQNGKRRAILGSVLVWSAFNGVPDEGKHIFHINGIASDDRLDNLTTDLKSDIRSLGLSRAIPVIKLSIRGDYIKRYRSLTAAAADNGMDRGTIANVARGKTGPLAKDGYIYMFEKDYEKKMEGEY